MENGLGLDPTFCEAIALTWEDGPTARAYLGSADRVMMSGFLGPLPEFLDGDEAQACSVTGALRGWPSC